MQELFCPISGEAYASLFSLCPTQGLPALSLPLPQIHAVATALLESPIWLPAAISDPSWSEAALPSAVTETGVFCPGNSGLLWLHQIAFFILLLSFSCLTPIFPAFTYSYFSKDMKDICFLFKVQSNPNPEPQGKRAGIAQLNPCSPWLVRARPVQNPQRVWQPVLLTLMHKIGLPKLSKLSHK